MGILFTVGFVAVHYGKEESGLGLKIGEIIVDIWKRDGNMYKLGILLRNK